MNWERILPVFLDILVTLTMIGALVLLVGSVVYFVNTVEAIRNACRDLERIRELMDPDEEEEEKR